MTVRSPLAKAVSLICATALTLGAARFTVPTTEVKVEGGGAPVEALMGATFEDMSVGTLTALPATNLEKPTPPQEIQQPNKLVQEVQAIQPVEIPKVSAPPPPDVATRPTVPRANMAPLPDTATPMVRALTSTTVVEPDEAIQPIVQPETIVAQTPDRNAPSHSKRPKIRNAALVAKIAKDQKAAQIKPKETKPATQQGNAKRNNTKGSNSGSSETAKATQTGRDVKAASQSGTAAASNYPGLIMRHLSRLPKPRVRSKGTAIIGFEVASNGGLRSVYLARSSGYEELDAAAVSLVRKAGPFPPPPSGARRQFSIQIKGK